MTRRTSLRTALLALLLAALALAQGCIYANCFDPFAGAGQNGLCSLPTR